MMNFGAKCRDKEYNRQSRNVRDGLTFAVGKRGEETSEAAVRLTNSTRSVSISSIY